VPRLAQTDPELIEYFDDSAFDEVLAHDDLDPQTRLMVPLSALIACPAIGGYRVMLGAALTVGVTPVQVKEIVYQAVPGAERVDALSQHAHLGLCAARFDHSGAALGASADGVLHVSRSTTWNRRPLISSGTTRTNRGLAAACQGNRGRSAVSRSSCARETSSA
jgi:alkylhydroperoxidase/carboxymuconolactone decarboxylase family protein YurZ